MPDAPLPYTSLDDDLRAERRDLRCAILGGSCTVLCIIAAIIVYTHMRV